MTFEEMHNRLKDRKVGIAGVGGLGSNCAVALARVGLGTLVVADFDIVSESNLNRQHFFRDQVGRPKVEAIAESIARIDPSVKIIACNVRLDRDNVKEIFRTCDIIVEAFDLAEQKEMLIESVLTAFPEMPLIIGLGMAGWGNSNSIQCRKSDNIYICGDEVSEIADELPPVAPRVGMVANMQANVVLEILLR